MDNTMLDIVVIGAGPAGVTAGIYAKRAGYEVVCLEQAGIGGQILSTYEIDNYPPLKGISGPELGSKMKEHAEGLGVVFSSEAVISVEECGSHKMVNTDKNQYKTKSVVIATGALHRNLGVAGEEELSGCGVSYCATCDGAFYRGAEVAVVGGGDVALEDALFLARTSAKVYLIHRRDSFRGAKVLQDAVFATDNIEVIWNSVVTTLNGVEDGELTGIEIEDKNSKEKRTLDVEGLFVAVGTKPNTEFLGNLVDMDEAGYIKASEDCRTSVSGIYVAGDVRTKALRQVVTAVADGANAVKSIETDLQEA